MKREGGHEEKEHPQGSGRRPIARCLRLHGRVCSWPAFSSCTSRSGCPPLMEAGQENQASRNLRQLRDEVEWRRLEGEVNSLEAQRREAAPPPAAQEPTVPAGAFRFRLEAVTHTCLLYTSPSPRDA